MNLEQEINQSVFKDNFHKAHVNLLFTAAWLNHKVNRLLKPYDISGQQFNILRILKGMGCKPSSLKLITSRMLDKTSNTSRLVDKLIDKNLKQNLNKLKMQRKKCIFLIFNCNIICACQLQFINQGSDHNIQLT